MPNAAGISKHRQCGMYSFLLRFYCLLWTMLLYPCKNTLVDRRSSSTLGFLPFGKGFQEVPQEVSKAMAIFVNAKSIRVELLRKIQYAEANFAGCVNTAKFALAYCMYV